MDIYIELSGDSRSNSISRTGASWPLVVVFCLDGSPPEFTGGKILGADDDIKAMEYAYSIFPEVREIPDYSGATGYIILESIEIEHIKTTYWRATATYTYDVNSGTGGERPEPSKPDTLPYVKINFSIGGGTKRIVKDITTKAKNISSKAVALGILDAPDVFGAIGITQDGIEGTEVPNATFRLQITAYYLPQYVTMGYATQLAALVAGKNNTGSYNASDFLGRPEGEVQFIGANGGGQVVDIIPITFEFDIKNNVNAVADPGFDALTMFGHDRVSYAFEHTFEETNAKKLVMTPMYRYVHQVSTPEDYSLISLPL